MEIANRIVRAGTSECMATATGGITDRHLRLYATLARNRVGLIFTGHMYCEPRGQYERGQPGIDSDAAVAGLARLTRAVHDHGGKIFAQIAHAGSQSLIAGNRPLAPSPVANAMTGRDVGEASAGEIEATIDAFGQAARRAVEAGFDGVHIHGANGYLVSEFSSPVTNRRADAWGAGAEGRDRFALEVVRRVRAAVPRTRGLSMKLGFVDAVPGGLNLDESVPRAARLVAAGLDAIEVSSNVMRGYADSAMPTSRSTARGRCATCSSTRRCAGVRVPRPISARGHARSDRGWRRPSSSSAASAGRRRWRRCSPAEMRTSSRWRAR